MYMTYKKIAHKVSENKYIDGLIWVHTGNEKGSIQCLAQKACKNNGHLRLLVEQMMN